MNIINPLDVAVGEGVFLNMSIDLRDMLEKAGLKNIADCLAAPTSEPHYVVNEKRKDYS